MASTTTSPTVTISMPDGSAKTVPVRGAYLRPGGSALFGADGSTRATDGPDPLLVVDEDGLPGALYLAAGDGEAYWAGALHQVALDRFDAAGPGGTFKYRNRSLGRMADAEVAALIEPGFRCVGFTG